VGLAFSILGHGADRAMDRQEWQAAADFMRDIDSLAVGRRFDGYPSSVLTRVAALRLLQRRGDVRAVRAGLAKAAVLRPTLSAANPVISVMGLLGYARLHLAVNDPAGARAVLHQASDILRQRPDLGILPAEVAALGKVLTAMPVGISGASALTTAELRVLQLLPYYLSFKEIAQRLGVKATTIKTHALAIYGKLGASSRSEAVDLAVEAGLMEPFPALRPASPIAEDVATAAK
jgi:LuxR family maltose regulon positive regulatory protein